MTSYHRPIEVVSGLVLIARGAVGPARELGGDPVHAGRSDARYAAAMTEPVRTPAIDALEATGVPFRVVRTEIARSAEESAGFQGIPVGSLLRSILVRRAADDYLFVLVPGGRRFDWPKLRDAPRARSA